MGLERERRIVRSFVVISQVSFWSLFEEEIESSNSVTNVIDRFQDSIVCELPLELEVMICEVCVIAE